MKAIALVRRIIEGDAANLADVDINITDDTLNDVIDGDFYTDITMPASVGTGSYYTRITQGVADAIIAKLGALSYTQLVTQWVRQNTYGSPGSGTAPNFNTPSQVALDSSGNIYIADTVNARLVKLTSAGAYSTSITSLSGIQGVCIDSSNNIYVVWANGVQAVPPFNLLTTLNKYNSSLVLQYSNTSPPDTPAIGHITTDNTHVYLTDFTNSNIFKHLCSTGAAVTTWAVVGNPYGICMSAGNVVITSTHAVDQVQAYDTVGSFLAFYTPGLSTTPCGIYRTASNFAIADSGNDRVIIMNGIGTLLNTFNMVNPDGIAVAAGDVVYASSSRGGNIQKWDEASVVVDEPVSRFDVLIPGFNALRDSSVDTVYFYEDFIPRNVSSGVIGIYGWASALTGSGRIGNGTTVDPSPSNVNHPGRIQIETGATNASTSRIYLGNFYWQNIDEVVMAWSTGADVTGATFDVGLNNSSTSWRLYINGRDPLVGNILINLSNPSLTQIDTGMLSLKNRHYKLTIRRLTDTSIRIYLDCDDGQHYSTTINQGLYNVANQAYEATFNLTNTVAATKIIYADLFQMKGSVNRGV